MLPGISAEDCLFAALGVDPSRHGCQSFEATDLIARARPIDPSAALIVWQIGVVGNLTFVPEGDLSRLGVLVEYLLQTYPEDHEVVAYEASLYSVLDDVIVRCPLGSLAEVSVSPAATLYVPPATRFPFASKSAHASSLARRASSSRPACASTVLSVTSALA
jgi:hypothetical protein